MIEALKPSRVARWLIVLGACLALTAADTFKRSDTGWLITVYYTPVESFHHGAVEPVYGCLELEGCNNGEDELGRYPASFIAAARDEGTGRITSGQWAGRYLNWSYDIGYWLDTSSRDSLGRALLPFRTAAADGLPEGSRVRVVDCGRLAEGGEPDAEVCRQFTSAEWRILDEFTPGLGGERHIDLYVGEETAEGFTESPLYTTLREARVELVE